MNNYIEIDADDAILDFERQMLAEVNIPSLLPVNIINQNEKNSVCFITTGYKPITQTDIPDIEFLCHMVKSFVKSIIDSEKYLLMGGKHFLDTDMVYYDSDTKETKLIFGRVNENNYHYGDINAVIEFLQNLKKSIEDRVYLQILEQIIITIKVRNPDMKRITILIEEIERKWYCKNLIQEFPFSKNIDKQTSGLN